MDPLSLSVTELCRAAVDPAFRASWRRGERPSTQVFGPPGTLSVFGTKFHGYACQLVKRLVREPGIPPDADGLLALLHEGGAAELLDGLIERGQVDEAAQLSNALHFFAERVAGLHARANGGGWADVFLQPEFPLRDVVLRVGARQVFVSGSIDCVRRLPDGTLEVVDYKLTRGQDLAKELVQVALYRRLLLEQSGAGRCAGALEYFLPDLHVQELTEADLDAAFAQWVEPTLRELTSGSSAGVTTERELPTMPSVPRLVRSTPPPPPDEAAGGAQADLLDRTSAAASRERLAAVPTDGSAAASKRAEPSGRGAPGAFMLQVGERRGAAPSPLQLDSELLKRHVAVLGGTGSGKTTLALGLVEQLLLAGVPVVLVDRKGDLCRYGDPRLAEGLGAPEGSRLRRWLERVDVAVFTPGSDQGRPLGIGLVPSGIDELSATDRLEACKNAAAGLAAMLKLRDSAVDQAKRAVLVQAVRLLAETRPKQRVTLRALIELIGGDDPALLESLGHLDPKHGKSLVQQLESLHIMEGQLLGAGAEELSAELLFGLGEHGVVGKTRLSIVSTKFLGGEATTLFWVAQLLLELNRFVSRCPSPRLSAAVLFDEADVYLPATAKPPTKPPLESLLKRARSAGLSVLLATQSPGDLDYRCRENVRSWFVGLIRESRALEKLSPLLSEARLDAAAVLPKQKVGQFFLVSESAAAPITASRNLVETAQLSELEILEIARWTRGGRSAEGA